MSDTRLRKRFALESSFEEWKPRILDVPLVVLSALESSFEEWKHLVVVHADALMRPLESSFEEWKRASYTDSGTRPSS